jgi:Kef-type K+ transport system membrane component KefB
LIWRVLFLNNFKQEVSKLERQTDPSLNGLFHAIFFQIAGIAIALIANSANFALILFADTDGYEIALCVPIIATALFTFVWGDATLQSQVANIKDATLKLRKLMPTNIYPLNPIIYLDL